VPPLLLLPLAAQRSDGPFLWIVVGIVLGLAVGFLYAGIRRAVERRRRR
jgi:uncharacterized protein involved in exopolysaccharide biosynthesis